MRPATYRRGAGLQGFPLNPAIQRYKDVCDHTRRNQGLNGASRSKAERTEREVHARDTHQEKRWNLGKHVKAHDTELYGILQATDYAKKWTARDPETDAIWIFVDHQAAIRRSLSPVATAGQHLTIRIIDNLSSILQVRPNIKINIQWVPGHTEVAGSEAADSYAKGAADLPGRCSDSFTSYIKRQIQEASLREWQQIWTATAKGHGYCNMAQI